MSLCEGSPNLKYNCPLQDNSDLHQQCAAWYEWVCLSDPFMRAELDKGEKGESSISLCRKQGSRQTLAALQLRIRSALVTYD